MTKNAIAHYESALKEAFPSGATGDVFHHWNEARKALAEQPAQQEPVECQYGKGGYACCEDGPCKADEQNNAPKPAQQEPVDIEHCIWARNGNTPCPHTSTPAQRKPLTDEQFLELLLRKGTQELVGVTTFVGGSIQMQGKIGLLRSAKIIKEFVEAAHGIKE
jgi:hypothetical protein